MRTRWTLLFLLSLVSLAKGQTLINAYAKVTGISGTTISLSNLNEANDTFEVGEKIILMQVQDDIIGSNTDQNSDFGNVDAIGSAGQFEVLEISSITESAGTPTSMALTSAPTQTYNTGSDGAVQIISFPKFSSYATSSDLSALAWDGNVGGVFAIDVEGTLTLQNNIRVDGLGFRGGATNPSNTAGGCEATTFYSSGTEYAFKGESAYRVTNPAYEQARGRSANGGGGGNSHNGGGGGGGNFTSGGDGGPGWASSGECSPSTGGLGGADLSSFISSSRMFLGGGGGGGQENNNVGTDGANGGGIIFIRASTLATLGGCGTLAISADGGSISLAGKDGSGGGGAGGSIMFQVPNWSLACEVNVSARGGEGGTVNHADTHGGGGGGGKGVVMLSSTLPSSNFTTDNSAGNGGANSTTATNGNADSGSVSPSSPSADADGILLSTSGALPIELTHWVAKAAANEIQLVWSTATEINNDFFTIERSSNGIHWDVIAQVSGKGNTVTQQDYQFTDQPKTRGILYYRLSQTDFDGTQEMFDVLSVDFQGFYQVKTSIYPNPTQGKVQVHFGSPTKGTAQVALYNMQGRMMSTQDIYMVNSLELDFSSQPKGTYLLKIVIGSTVSSSKVIIE